jgi:hypothetical protein
MGVHRIFGTVAGVGGVCVDVSTPGWCAYIDAIICPVTLLQLPQACARVICE